MFPDFDQGEMAGGPDFHHHLASVRSYSTTCLTAVSLKLNVQHVALRGDEVNKLAHVVLGSDD